MKKLFVVCFLSVFSQILFSEGVDFSYKLEKPSRVSIVIERLDGSRVRNLLSDVERRKGNHTENWDGRDDYGNGVDAGKYRWRAILHDEIEASYLGSFYSPGSTPWKRHSRPGGWNIHAYGGGGWLSDHECPYSLYTDDKHVYIGCQMAEAGDAIIQCDLDGNKIWGQMWLGLSGANAMCTEGDVLYVAGEGHWMGSRMGVNRYNIKEYKWVMTPEEIRKKRIQHDSAFVRERSEDFSGIEGIFLTSNHIVVAFNDKKRLAYFDRTTSLFVKEEPMKNARELSLKPFTKIFRGRATDKDGNIYFCVTNKNEQCVKVYSPDMKFIRRIGKKGGRKEGKYDPEAMSNPVDVAIDAKGNVWVCEYSFLPKRVSVWTREGKLLREYVGTPFYGGGGSIDGHTAYYSGMRFKFNKDFSRATLDAILFNPEEHPDLPYKAKVGPSEYRAFRGKKYLMDDDGACKTETPIMEIVGDRLVPRVVFGTNYEKGEDGRTFPRGVYFWKDGKKTISQEYIYGAEWGLRMGPDMEIILRTRNQNLAVFKPLPGDELNYDFSKPEIITLEENLKQICSLSITPDANSFIVNVGGCGNQGSTNNMFCGVSRDGKKILWNYPNPFPSNTHNSPIPKRGELRHTLGLEGFATTTSGITTMLLNGNKGTRYLFTQDGIFVQELFGDARTTKYINHIPEAKRGVNMAKYSLADECFGGWLGNIGKKAYVIEGKDSLNLCELKNHDSIQYFGGGELLLNAKVKSIFELPPSERPPVKTIRAGGFGLTHNWWEMATYSFGNAKFAIGYSKNEITYYINVKDSTPFENKGDAPHTLFHSGDAIDLRWEGNPKANKNRTTAEEGDIRLVIAPDGDDKIKIIKYVFVDPKMTLAPIEFASPVSTYKVSRVEEVSLEDVKYKITRKKDEYTLLLSLPWKKVMEEKEDVNNVVRRGDVGVIYGDESSTRVIHKSYYYDPGSQEVSDIPSETRVNPSAWGKIEF